MKTHICVLKKETMSDNLSNDKTAVNNENKPAQGVPEPRKKFPIENFFKR